MTFRTETCIVGNSQVTLVTDFAGTITMVICPDYEYASGTCAHRRRRAGMSPLTQFMQRVAPESDPRNRCVYWQDVDR